jgi:DNA-binding CsgD family transcriptional regulator
VTDPVFEKGDSTKLLIDLQHVNSIANSFNDCLDPDAIARRVTDGLVEKFGCVFARIWLMETDCTALKLVASSGLYCRTNGFFARVPIGAFKVGKIAQNQIPFLSNQLAAETWVLDRDWAILHGIQGFAGYPLIVNGDSIGVLAVFSQAEMLPEFLEILQSLCTATTIGLAAALRDRQAKLIQQSSTAPVPPQVPLSEQIATILKPTQLALVGTERSLPLPLHNLMLRAAEVLSQLSCIHSRLTYIWEEESARATLEAVISDNLANTVIINAFEAIRLESMCLGGTLETQTHASSKMLRVLLTIAVACQKSNTRVNLRCRSAVLQMAFAQLIELAGLSIAPIADPNLPLLTDDRSLISDRTKLLWIATDPQIPDRALGKIDWSSTTPSELRSAVEAVMQGRSWGIAAASASESIQLSEREREIMQLLTQGLRDRDIAVQLIISESTVKFHINNILAKLNAKTRIQALYQAIDKGLI